MYEEESEGRRELSGRRLYVRCSRCNFRDVFDGCVPSQGVMGCWEGVAGVATLFILFSRGECHADDASFLVPGVTLTMWALLYLNAAPLLRVVSSFMSL